MTDDFDKMIHQTSSQLIAVAPPIKLFRTLATQFTGSIILAQKINKLAILIIDCSRVTLRAVLFVSVFFLSC